MNKLELEAAYKLQTTVIESLEQAAVAVGEQISKLEEDVKNQELYTKGARDEKDSLQLALDSMHACFDEIEGVMPRFKEQEEAWMSKVEMPLPARFASYCRTLIK